MKKGFTLAELLGVLIVLAVIATIVTPIISKSIKSNKQSLYNSQLEEIKQGAEKWAYSNLELLPTIEEKSITITLYELKKSGFLTLNIRNPITGELFPNDMVITITYKNNNYDFFVDGESGTDIDSEINSNSPSIVLNGHYVEYVEINSKYEEKNAVAKDKDGNILSNIQIMYQLNGVEVSKIDVIDYNTYTAIYSVTDNGYTSKTTRTIIIRDTTPPEITIPSSTELTVNQLNNFNLLEDVSVVDNSGEDITIQTSGFDRLPIDKIVEYKACDSHGNCTVKRRLIKIIN